MRIEFDPTKDKANRKKHGVSLTLGSKLDWEHIVVRADDHHDELRWVGIAPLADRLYRSSTPCAARRFASSACAKPPTARYAIMNRRFKRNTRAEEARIKAGIRADADTHELTDKELAEMLPARRGRPISDTRKVPVTVRLDPEVVKFFRESGPGWQGRMNAALTRYVSRQRR